MQAMVCELCSSTDIIKQDGVYVCQNCGTKYSVEEARKLIGAVAVEKKDEADNMLILARRAKEENNNENAAKYYDLVLQKDPTNWEASFYLVYFQAMGCRIINIANAAYSIANNLDGTIKLIHDHVPEGEQDAALKEVKLRSTMICLMLSGAAINHYNNHSSVDGVADECSGRVVAAGSILSTLESALKKHFPDKQALILDVLKARLSFISENGRWFNSTYRTNAVNSLTAEIQKQDSTYIPPEVKTGGCYVATAVYGSYDCPQVWTLRRYRDYTLAKTWHGRAFIRLYYAVSPTIVKIFGNNSAFRKFWKARLDKMVAGLQSEGVSDKPYKDINW